MMTMEEDEARRIVRRVLDRDEPIIVKEMIEAGADIIWRSLSELLPHGSEAGREMAVAVFAAMMDVCPAGSSCRSR